MIRSLSIHPAFAALALSLGLAPNLLGQEKPTAIDFFPSASPSAPYSEAVRIGDTLYVSGQLGTIPGKGLVPGGIEAETRQTLENIKAILERRGSSLDQVAKCTVFLADIKDFPAFNAIYREYFKNASALPARTTVAASLVIGARIEIDCIAYTPSAK